jgi:hypothetical protein
VPGKKSKIVTEGRVVGKTPRGRPKIGIIDDFNKMSYSEMKTRRTDDYDDDDVLSRLELLTLIVISPLPYGRSVTSLFTVCVYLQPFFSFMCSRSHCALHNHTTLPAVPMYRLSSSSTFLNTYCQKLFGFLEGYLPLQYLLLAPQHRFLSLSQLLRGI